MDAAVNGDEAGDAAGQNERREDERPAEGAGGIEAPVAAEGDDDISLEVRGLPAFESAADFGNHGDFEQTTAGGAEQTARRKGLSKQEYRHNYLAAFRRVLQRSGSTGGVCFYYLT